ncbi:hypothetical protein FXO38_08856 [Capsicum annuum]|nr:hypothetical protein FXO38_08856 [Capsicum annuum]
MLKNSNKLEVYVSQRVIQPDHAPFQLEYIPNTSDKGVGDKYLNPINEGDAFSLNFQPSSPNFPSNHPNEPPLSNTPSKFFDPTIDEDPSDDDLEDDSDLERNTSRDSPDIGYDKSNVGTRDNLVSKLGDDEPYYLSDEVPRSELYGEPMNNMKMWPTSNNPAVKPPKIRKLPGRPHKIRRKGADESRKTGKLSKYGTAGASTGRGRGRAIGSGLSHAAGTSYQQEPGIPSRKVISTSAKVTKRSDIVTGDIGYTPRQGFKRKEKLSITNRKLTRMKVEKVIQTRSAAAAKTPGKNISTMKTHVPWK